MRFSERIKRSFIVVLVILLLATGISSSILFNNSLNNFLINQRRKEFNQIAKDIQKLVRSKDTLTDYSLENYAKNKNINITYFLKRDKEYFRHYIGINAEKNNNINLVSEKYILVNDEEKEIGYLKISYVEDVFEYDQSSKEFYTNMIRNYAFIFILTLILAYWATIYINKSLNNSIVDIKEKTKKIRNKNYNLTPVKYNIYELDELSDDINFLAKSLNMQEQYRSDYARDIAHELRTPITNLLLHLEGIHDEIIEADKTTIDLLLSEVKRINVMIDNLETSFNKTEELVSINIEEINLSDLVTNVSNSFLPLMNEKNIKLEKHYNDNIIIETDKNKMTQILINIISNAIKAIEHNGLIEISIESFSNRHVIRISDNGIGMDTDEISQIFDRFYRVDNVRNTKVSGHGLGLSITKNFIDLLGYNISVNSTPKKGSEFIITINN